MTSPSFPKANWSGGTPSSVTSKAPIDRGAAAVRPSVVRHPFRYDDGTGRRAWNNRRGTVDNLLCRQLPAEGVPYAV